MTGEGARRVSAGTDAQDNANGAAPSAPAGASAPVEASAPVDTKPLNAIALAKEVILDRLQGILERLLRRLKRYRERRGDWWET